jgi:hypothetical protein
MQKGIGSRLNQTEEWNMRSLFAIAALAAGLASHAANADPVHRHRGAGVMRHTTTPAPAPASFQSLSQDGGLSNDCQGQRIFGFCPVR